MTGLEFPSILSTFIHRVFMDCLEGDTVIELSRERSTNIPSAVELTLHFIRW